MNRDFFAAGENNIREKTFVAADQCSFDEGLFESHLVRPFRLHLGK